MRAATDEFATGPAPTTNTTSLCAALPRMRAEARATLVAARLLELAPKYLRATAARLTPEQRAIVSRAWSTAFDVFVD